MPVDESFIIRGFQFKTPDNRQVTKRALRELQQKRFMNHSIVKNKKKTCKFGDVYKCPHCNSYCARLTAAHIGVNAAKYIDYIIAQHIDTSIHHMNSLICDEDCKTSIAICCDTCNKKFEAYENLKYILPPKKRFKYSFYIEHQSDM